MLADEVLAFLAHFHNADKFRSSFADRIKLAQRFVLSTNFKEAAAQIQRSSPASFIKILPLVRLPYSVTWIERSGAGSETWKDNKIDRPDAILPDSFGTLVENITEDGTVFLATSMWRHKVSRDLPSYAGVVVCPISVLMWVGDLGHESMMRSYSYWLNGGAPVDDEEQIKLSVELYEKITTSNESREEFKRKFNDYNKEEMDCAFDLENRCMSVMGPYHYDLVKHTNISDWENDLAAEGGVLLGVLGLINSRNNVEMEKFTFDKLNKKRRRNGASDLLSYSVVKISLSQREKAYAAKHGMTTSEVRRHMVRGHFKVKKKGIYWWRPFIRGAGIGEVRHDKYEVLA